MDNKRQEAKGRRMKKQKKERYGRNNSQEEAKLEQEQQNVYIPCYSHH